MGQGGTITLVNGTGSDWKRTYQHSYQMNSWSFPETVAAGSSTRVYVEWDQGIFKHQSDDGGEATYTLSGTGETFQVQARASDHFKLQTYFEGLSAAGSPKGSTLDLGWVHDGAVPFVLAGPRGGYVSNQVSGAWMQSSRAWLGCRPLRHLCLPGSHDAGMSEVHAGTAFGKRCNVQTQVRSILGQLEAGARYFDVRPVITDGHFRTGHYGRIDQIDSWQGANGQSIASIVEDVNSFLDKNAELVILRLSHDLNTDVGNSSYRPLNQAEWDRLFQELLGLRHRYVACSPTDVDLSAQRLDSFIGAGEGAVLLLVDPSGSEISIKNYTDKGFYKPANFAVYDRYADRNDVRAMMADQYAKLKAQRTSPDDECFLLSWTLTQDAGQAIGCIAGLGKSILDLAEEAHPFLYETLLSHCTRQSYPNILYIDAVNSGAITALAVAVNLVVGG